MMISDWSGVAIEYALSQAKPTLFIDVPKKINNPDYVEIDITPIEISIRPQIGSIVLPRLEEITIELLDGLAFKPIDSGSVVFNSGRASKVGASEILRLMSEG